MKQFIVVETIHAVPGKYEALKQALLEVVPFSLHEQGCLHYEVAEPQPHKDVLLVLMRWETAQAFEDHANSIHVQEFVKKYEDVLYDAFEETCWLTC